MAGEKTQAELDAQIDAGIRTNGNREITPPIHNAIEKAITNSNLNKKDGGILQALAFYSSALSITDPLTLVYKSWVESAVSSRYQYNVQDYGVLPDSSTDVSADLQALIGLVPEGSTLFFPSSGDDYIISSQVNIDKRLNIVGLYNAVLKTSANVKIFNIQADEVKIHNIRFNGSTSGGSQKAVYSDGYTKFELNGCRFKEFGNRAVEILHTENGDLGGSIVNCEFYNNYSHGIYLGERAEFIRVINCNFRNNITAIEIRGGNNIVTACNINYNDNGIVIDSGSNNGHGTVSSCNINHNVYTLKYFNTTLGYTFSGNHIYQGSIYIKDSTSVDIYGGILSPSDWYFEGCTNINVFDNTISYDYGNSVNNNYNSTIGYANWHNNRNLDGTYNDDFNANGFRGNGASTDLSIVNGDILLNGRYNYLYGNESTDGSIREYYNVGTDEIISEKRVAGVWTFRGSR